MFCFWRDSEMAISHVFVEIAFGRYFGIEPRNDGDMTIVAVEYGVDLEF